MITSSPAKIIVSPIAIPDTSMGSWGKIIDYWLQDYVGNTVNYVLSPRSTVTFKSGRTQAIDCSYSSTEINHPLFLKWRFKKFFSGLQTVFAKHKLAVILVIENTKIKNAVADWLEKNGLEKRARIIFYQVGFTYEFNRDEYKHFKRGLHEIVLLTKNAYDYDRKKYHEYPFIVHVLHNPVNKDIFFKLSAEARMAQRLSLGWQPDHTVFLWVSHDRPKKGLDLILGIWPTVVAKYPEAKLVVVGAVRNYSYKGLHFAGRMPNQQIAAYYQAADVFLFSTLCMEGYGLSLTEAISCGCYCIASNSGGIPEVLQGTNHALINDPNMEQAWLQAIDDYMQNRPVPLIGLPFLSISEWCYAFENILQRAGERLLQNQPEIE
jgi:L-malate glycosyltransferase